MSDRKWLYKPGERMAHRSIAQAIELSGNKLQQFLDLTEEYSDAFPQHRTLVLNDNKDIVFFAQLNESMTGTGQVHVFIWNGESYRATPPETAVELSKKYFDYLDVVADAYHYLEGER